MYIEVILKTKSPWIGGSSHPDKKDHRVFDRTANGDIRIHAAQWAWAVRRSIESFELDVRPEHFKFPDGFRAPTLYTHKRAYKSKGAMRTEMFESIRPGARLTFRFSVLECEDLATVESILAYIGDVIGLSPWGSAKHGYGRFDVLSLTRLTVEHYREDKAKCLQR